MTPARSQNSNHSEIRHRVNWLPWKQFGRVHF